MFPSDILIKLLTKLTHWYRPQNSLLLAKCRRKLTFVNINRYPDDTPYSDYTHNGFLMFQVWMANYALMKETGNPNASISLGVVPMKTQPYKTNNYGQVITGLPFFQEKVK